ncbi:hypothetical protein O181_029131 [Austropuccinia psidii MF-1]|uniref:Uncharacterized protein n=1 Tax=Austropuccinia psidii MF-1 TaxID=1389203 RepID=A0A9Q3H312_9BASI|nr:hypothetical protein [Austropuccinia psidii MF-1]
MVSKSSRIIQKKRNRGNRKSIFNKSKDNISWTKQNNLLSYFDAKNDLNFITQEIALKAELNISPYTSKTTDSYLKTIGQIKNVEVTFESEEKTYLDLLVFENFNQIIIEEKSSILSSSKESMPAVTHIKSKGKETEDKLEVEDSEAIEKIKEELKKMRRNLDIAIEDPEKWLALELSGMNK